MWFRDVTVKTPGRRDTTHGTQCSPLVWTQRDPSFTEATRTVKDEGDFFIIGLRLPRRRTYFRDDNLGDKSHPSETCPWTPQQFLGDPDGKDPGGTSGRGPFPVTCLGERPPTGHLLSPDPGRASFCPWCVEEEVFVETDGPTLGLCYRSESKHEVCFVSGGHVCAMLRPTAD